MKNELIKEVKDFSLKRKEKKETEESPPRKS
jgi:hypothetical protein